jgi:hypothetical protein
MSRTTVQRSERGQALPALALIVAGLVAFTTFVIVPLGSADDRRAETRTGADAAALAAVDSVRDGLIALANVLPPGLGGGPGNGNILLDGLDRLPSDAAVAADDYARRNDSDLTDFQLTIDLDGLRPVIRALAHTRNQDAVETTDRFARAQATAELDVLHGFCGVDGAWGLELDDGSCRSLADLLDPLPPTPTPTPTPTGTTSPTPTPTPTPTPEPLPHRVPLDLSDPALID